MNRIDQHRSPPRGFSSEGYARLSNAIVILAARDYRQALKALRKNPHSGIAMEKAMECERFFDGEWIKVLTSVDGQWLKDRLREEVRQ